MDWGGLALAAPHRKSMKHNTLAIGTLVANPRIWVLHNIKRRTSGCAREVRTAEGQGDTGEGGGGWRQTLNSHSNTCSRILPRGAFHDFVHVSWLARYLDFSRILTLHWWACDLLFVLVVVVANRDRNCYDCMHCSSGGQKHECRNWVNAVVLR